MWESDDDLTADDVDQLEITASQAIASQQAAPAPQPLNASLTTNQVPDASIRACLAPSRPQRQLAVFKACNSFSGATPRAPRPLVPQLTHPTLLTHHRNAPGDVGGVRMMGALGRGNAGLGKTLFSRPVHPGSDADDRDEVPQVMDPQQMYQVHKSLERFKADNERLQKESEEVRITNLSKQGEIRILRDKLAKAEAQVLRAQTESLAKVDIEKSVQFDQLQVKERELESVRSELIFKDREMQELRTKLKQVEASRKQVASPTQAQGLPASTQVLRPPRPPAGALRSRASPPGTPPCRDAGGFGPTTESFYGPVSPRRASTNDRTREVADAEAQTSVPTPATDNLPLSQPRLDHPAACEPSAESTPTEPRRSAASIGTLTARPESAAGDNGRWRTNPVLKALQTGPADVCSRGLFDLMRHPYPCVHKASDPLSEEEVANRLQMRLGADRTSGSTTGRLVLTSRTARPTSSRRPRDIRDLDFEAAAERQATENRKPLFRLIGAQKVPDHHVSTNLNLTSKENLAELEKRHCAFSDAMRELNILVLEDTCDDINSGPSQSSKCTAIFALIKESMAALISHVRSQAQEPAISDDGACSLGLQDTLALSVASDLATLQSSAPTKLKQALSREELLNNAAGAVAFFGSLMGHEPARCALLAETRAGVLTTMFSMMNVCCIKYPRIILSAIEALTQLAQANSSNLDRLVGWVDSKAALTCLASPDDVVALASLKLLTRCISSPKVFSSVQQQASDYYSAICDDMWFKRENPGRLQMQNWSIKLFHMIEVYHGINWLMDEFRAREWPGDLVRMLHELVATLPTPYPPRPNPYLAAHHRPDVTLGRGWRSAPYAGHRGTTRGLAGRHVVGLPGDPLTWAVLRGGMSLVVSVWQAEEDEEMRAYNAAQAAGGEAVNTFTPQRFQRVRHEYVLLVCSILRLIKGMPSEAGISKVEVMKIQQLWNSHDELDA